MWKNAFSFQGKKKRWFLLCDRAGNKSVACQVKQQTDVIVAPRGLHKCFLFSPPFLFWFFVNKKKDGEREREIAYAFM